MRTRRERCAADRARRLIYRHSLRLDQHRDYGTGVETELAMAEDAQDGCDFTAVGGEREDRL